MDETRMQGMKK